MNLAPLINAFPTKIKVTFINTTTGKSIGVSKMTADQLPISFNKPTTIEFGGAEWRIMKATPLTAAEFILTKKLILHVQKVSDLDTNSLGFNYPSICYTYPESLAEILSTDFNYKITKEQWQQVEFLPSSLLPSIQNEMKEIESILFPSDNVNTLIGYKTMHIRSRTISETLVIPLNYFLKGIGLSTINDNSNFRNTIDKTIFLFYSDTNTYYGILTNGIITELCLASFENIDEEIYNILTLHDLVLVDWRNGKILSV